MFSVENYKNNIDNIKNLEYEESILSNKLNETISEKVKLRKLNAMIRMSFIIRSSKDFPENKQECTCNNPLEDYFIKCRKHLSRHYENQGCSKCGWTDCSFRNC